ncbi:unnamed protein product [Caenorhabditis auriculariae]|uniref:Uncharacterized protein n=1 Tax=Caenorhabditis auriculariae TaxID=2777116 RepID=A0A8S1HXK7_9PELO|nr:unnamed protein product [Caenorhabditis auriculariae]
MTTRAPTWRRRSSRSWRRAAGRRYSSDLASSDYHLLRPLKHHLAGRKFANYDNLKSDFADFFETQLRSFGRRASATIVGPFLHKDGTGTCDSRRLSLTRHSKFGEERDSSRNCNGPIAPVCPRRRAADNVARRAVWIPRDEEPPKTSKADLLPLKIMLCCWTVTASIFTDQLEELAGVIGEKRPRRALQKLATLGCETVSGPRLLRLQLVPSARAPFGRKKIHQLRQPKIRLRGLLRVAAPGVLGKGHRRPAQSMGHCRE